MVVKNRYTHLVSTELLRRVPLHIIPTAAKVRFQSHTPIYTLRIQYIILCDK